MKSFCILQCVSWVICEFNPHKVWIIINGNQLIFFAHENWKSSLENCVMVVAGGIKTSFSIENFHISIKLLGNLFATAPGCIRSNYKEIFTFAVHQLMLAGWVSEWACGALIMFCKVINGSNSNSSVLILSSWMRECLLGDLHVNGENWAYACVSSISYQLCEGILCVFPFELLLVVYSV